MRERESTLREAEQTFDTLICPGKIGVKCKGWREGERERTKERRRVLSHVVTVIVDDAFYSCIYSRPHMKLIDTLDVCVGTYTLNAGIERERGTRFSV